MIIISTKNFCDIKEKTKTININFTSSKNYISSIEYIGNEFNDVLIKITRRYYIEYFNLKGKHHNPIGPAYKRFRHYSGTLMNEEYYINGKYYNSKEHFEKALNDYHKL